MAGLPLPPHFDPERAGTVHRVDYGSLAPAAEAWAKRLHIPAAANDARRVGLLLVDCQNTFCLPDFELFVGGRSGRGAIEDSARLCAFIYRNLAAITQITATLDTHAAAQIFHPIFWVNDAGEHPVGGQTIISVEDVESGTWKVNPLLADSVANGDVDWLARHALHYVRTLAQGRYPLMVWPYHAMVGGIGHALVSLVEEAAFFHGIARQCRTRFQLKGGNPVTEHYSALRPEVLKSADGQQVAIEDAEYLDFLFSFDRLIVAGQAKSHCVAWTVSDLLDAVGARKPGFAECVYLLEDCTSSVVVPDVVDFTDEADAAFRRFAEAGMHLVKSTHPMDRWPGFDG